MKEKSTMRTMLMSVLMSAPGPLIIALGLRAGQSATQLADLVRRSAELAALIAALIVFLLTQKSPDIAARARLERRVNRFVGASMCLSGVMMLLLAVLSGESTGNVLPSLVIAVLGLMANTLFWRKYVRLAQGGSAIVAVQGRLYRAKALVDLCVTLALICVLCWPGSPFADVMDRAGSAAVAAYLLGCGVRTIRETLGGGRSAP